MLLQIRRSVGGSCASTFQKLLTQSVFRVAMMSSYTARTGADALAYSIGSRLAVISSTSGGAPRLWPKPSMSEGRPKQRAASPPSRYTAAGISSGEVPMRARSPSMRITAAAALAAAGAAGAAPTAEAAVAAQPVQPSAAGMHTFESLALSPDGVRIASVEIERSFDSPAALHGPIVVRSTADAHVLERLDPCALCRYAGLTWSPDGRELAFIGSDPVKGEAQLALARGTQLTVLARIQGVAESPRFSPDGRELAILATVAAKKRTGALEAGAPPSGEIGVEFDEQRIAIVPERGGELHFVSPADTYVYEYDWMPDGRGFVGTAAKGDGDANWWIAELDAFDIGGGSRRIA